MGKYTNKYEIIIYQIIRKLVIPAGMRVSSAMDGNLNPSLEPGFRHKSVWNGFALTLWASGRIA